jgi:hypothetical protein
MLFPPHLDPNAIARTPSRTFAPAALFIGALFLTAGFTAAAVLRFRSPRPAPVKQELASVAPTNSSAREKTPPPPIDDDPLSAIQPSRRVGGAPSWAMSSGAAPEPEDATDLFALGSEMNADFSDRLVVCRVWSAGKSDTFLGDDLRVTVTLGSTPSVTNDGPDDGNRAFVTLPHARLSHGDAVAFHVVDRDAFSDDEIGESASVYTRTGLRASGALFSVECRALSETATSNALAQRKRSAESALGRVESAKLDETRSDLGLPSERIRDARSRITDAAVLVGWDDANVQALLTSHDAAVHALEDQRASIVADMRRRAEGKHEAEIADTRVTVTAVTCEGGSCTAKLHVENESKAPLVFNAGGTLAGENRVGLELVEESSWPHRIATAADGTKIDGRSTSDVDVPIPSPGALLTVCSARKCVALECDQ